MNTSTLSHRDSLIQVYSDFHKDAYGFRPRHIDYSSMSVEELEADFARFAAVCKENAEAEKKAEKAAVIEFNASIKKLVAMGAGNAKTAYRWLADAGVAVDGWDMDFYFWKLGISKYTAAGKAIHDKMLPHWRKALKME